MLQAWVRAVQEDDDILIVAVSNHGSEESDKGTEADNKPNVLIYGNGAYGADLRWKQILRVTGLRRARFSRLRRRIKRWLGQKD
jgi:hypothetical protein